MKYLDKFLQRWRIRKTAPYIAPGASVLDIGSADGALFREIPGLKDSVGIDLELDYSSRPDLPHVTFYQGPFPDVLSSPRTFDVVTMLATLEHIPPDCLAPLAKAIAQHLRPDGHLIVSVPDPSVDHILIVLQKLRLIHGMATEQHHGFDVSQTPGIFARVNLRLVTHKRFQLGLNHLFIFQRELSALS